MENKYNLGQITKTLEKLFSAGFNTDKKILSMKLEDLGKLNNLTSVEMLIIIEFKEAIKNKKIIMEKMKKYNVEVELNGIINFEVEAIDYEDAQRKVDDLLSVTSVREAIKEWNETMKYSSRISDYEEMEEE